MINHGLDHTVNSYGVSKRFESNSLFAKELEELKFQGYTKFENVVSQDEIETCKLLIDKIYKEQINEFGSEELLYKIDDAYVARVLMGYDDFFAQFISRKLVMNLATEILGNNFILLSQNAIINHPMNSQYQVRWHRDLNYQHWTCSQILAFHVLFCIDDFNAETGGTYILPGSHMFEEFPSDDYIKKHQKVIEAKAGTMLLINAMTYHRAGTNYSPNVRRAVNHIIGLPFLAQQIDIANMLDGKYQDDPKLAQFFGYRWRAAPDVTTWRNNKLNRSPSIS